MTTLLLSTLAACAVTVWAWVRWARVLLDGVYDDLWHETFDLIFN